MSLVKTDVPGLVKDKSGMVIAADDGEYRRILALRKARREEQDLKNRVAVLERQVAELLAR